MPKRRPLAYAAYIPLTGREHDRALAAPQPFPLSGDGKATGGLYDRLSGRVIYQGKRPLAAAIAEARYLDWLAARKPR